MSILDRVYKAATVGNGTERWLATSTSSILRLLLAAGRTSGEFSRTVAKRVETSVHKHRIQVALLVVPFLTCGHYLLHKLVVEEVMVAGVSLD